jgi:hypothetical protein
LMGKRSSALLKRSDVSKPEAGPVSAGIACQKGCLVLRKLLQLADGASRHPIIETVKFCIIKSAHQKPSPGPWPACYAD